MDSLKIFSSTFLLAACMTLQAQTQSQTPPTVKAYYEKFDSLLRKMDASGIEKLVSTVHTKDFVTIEPPDKKGKVIQHPLSDTIKGLKGAFQVVNEFTKVSSHIDSVKADKDTLVLTVSSTIAGSTKKTNDGSAHKLVVAGTAEDTWIKSGDSWQRKSSKILSRKTTWDGRTL
jgi:hypothetical protein